jgi:hypothetical protein
MSSINSVSNYWSGSSNFGTPKKTTTKATAGNVDPLALYWGRPAWGLQKAGSNAPSFKLQKNSLDIQATDFITQWDANQDGVLDFNEFKQSDGLTGNVKTNIGSAELAQALWAVVAGPDGTLSAAEYSRALLGMDENADGVITQAESNKIKTQWATEANEDPGTANVRIYNRNVALGTNAGLDTEFGLGFEEKYAKSLEADLSIKKKTAGSTQSPSAKSSTDVSALLASLGIKLPSTTPAKGLDLPIFGETEETELPSTDDNEETTTTSSEDANEYYGLRADVIADLREPETVVDGLPIV